MLNLIQKIWEEIRTSYWFIPSCLCLLTIVLAHAVTAENLWLYSRPFSQIDWIYQSTAGSARDILSTIASSIITVAGVTFSITIASVVHASGQFGPRLLSNFMQDKGNQVTLGVFIATFVYCILVMQRIDDPIVAEGRPLPYLGIVLGVLFALVNMGFLIFFVHHVAASLHSSNIVDSIGRELVERIQGVYKKKHQAGPDSSRLARDSFSPLQCSPGGRGSAKSESAGYVQFVDYNALLKCASAEKLTLAVNALPGDFVSLGDCLVWAVDGELSDNTRRNIRDAYIIGARRTANQDVMFLANELVEIAARALSPGTTDPITAMQCLDWLGTAMSELASLAFTKPLMRDTEGTVRLIINVKDYSRVLNETLDVLRPYVLTDRNATLHCQKVIARLMIRVEERDLWPLFLEKAVQLKEQSREYLSEYDFGLVSERHEVLQQILDSRDNLPCIAFQNRWLGSSDG